ncbi:adenosylcobinamide-GDP ribazoletransferase [Bradyrhizobium sp. ARR65]|uniref:adenosylcobinamide-GDP ribazoletransferase n=1 Tax=Bradyrhizobium sp. ARR65 TaxID=1040989 RepID=UPI000464E771|nr:adenosylcobinamide-GDP ribazoletransferase [Bradyrhizobium sp. ARR65]
MEREEGLRSFVQDLRIAVTLCTRLPVGSLVSVAGGEVARASWAFPVAGLLVGLLGAVTYWLASRLHIPPQAASVLALAATISFTGAMHEDGLADTADGFGGGKTRERKLEIMRDSRIGTFGACALGVSLLLRWSAIASFDDWHSVAIALVVAHGGGRAGLPAFMRFLPLARPDGLSSGAGQPPIQSVVIALGLGIVVLLIGFGTGAMLIGCLAVAAIGLLLARLSLSQIGGQTGDVIGAFEQMAEAALLLTGAALL